MLKALFKKQFQELFRSYFNTKSGERRSKAGTIAFFALFAFLLVILGSSFFTIGTALTETVKGSEIEWLYFTIMGLLAVIFGIFGSVFNTFTALYKAKDNEFLLSLPIPPYKILFVRLSSVYILSLMYESIVFIPALLAYYLFASPSVIAVITSFLMLFILAFFISTLTCAFGWLVAYISSKFKNRSFLTVIIAVVFFLGYYYLVMNSVDLIDGLIENATGIASMAKGAAYPLYMLGMAANGSLVDFVIVTLAIALLSGLTYFIMSKTFIKIVTKTEVSKKAVYKSTIAKQTNVQVALFKKEWKRFTSSASYMLNCGLGIVFMVIASVAAIVYPLPLDGLAEELGMAQILPLIPLLAGSFLCSMNIVSAPSVSLEGKTIWVLQTLPIDTKLVLKAKLYVHYLVNIPFVIILTVCMTIAFKLQFYYGILVGIALVLVIMTVASFGLIMGLLNPNLHWVNETFAIKQGASVLITLMGGVLLAFLLSAAGYFSVLVMDAAIFFVIVIALLAIAIYFMQRWLFTKGAKIFEKLS